MATDPTAIIEQPQVGQGQETLIEQQTAIIGPVATLIKFIQEKEDIIAPEKTDWQTALQTIFTSAGIESWKSYVEKVKNPGDIAALLKLDTDNPANLQLNQDADLMSAWNYLDEKIPNELKKQPDKPGYEEFDKFTGFSALPEIEEDIREQTVLAQEKDSPSRILEQDRRKREQEAARKRAQQEEKEQMEKRKKEEEDIRAQTVLSQEKDSPSKILEHKRKRREQKAAKERAQQEEREQMEKRRKEEEDAIRQKEAEKEKLVMGGSFDIEEDVGKPEDRITETSLAMEEMEKDFWKSYKHQKSTFLATSFASLSGRNTFSTNTIFYIIIFVAKVYVAHFLLRPKYSGKSVSSYKVSAFISFAGFPLVAQILLHPGISIVTKYAGGFKWWAIRLAFVLLISTWFLSTLFQLQMINELIAHGEGPDIESIIKKKGWNWYRVRQVFIIIHEALCLMLCMWLFWQNILNFSVYRSIYKQNLPKYYPRGGKGGIEHGSASSESPIVIEEESKMRQIGKGIKRFNPLARITKSKPQRQGYEIVGSEQPDNPESAEVTGSSLNIEEANPPDRGKESSKTITDLKAAKKISDLAEDKEKKKGKDLAAQNQ